jgi:hypothetical protein
LLVRQIRPSEACLLHGGLIALSVTSDAGPTGMGYLATGNVTLTLSPERLVR